MPDESAEQTHARIAEAERKVDASASGQVPPDVLAMTMVRASGDTVLMSMDPHVLVRLGHLARTAVGGPLVEWDFGVFGEAVKHRKAFAWWWKDKPPTTKIPLDYIVGRDDGAKFYEGMAQAHAWSRELSEVQHAGRQ